LYVAAPPVTPYTFGLFSVAAMPAPPVDEHWACGVQYEPYLCGSAKVEGDRCAEPQPDKAAEEGVPLVEGTPFTVFAGFNCHLPGRSREDVMDRARQALALGEQRAVEDAYWTGAAGSEPRLADPSAVVLNPAGSTGGMHPVSGLGDLEAYLAEHYGGTGVIHAPRGVIPALAAYQQVSPERGGARLLTTLGTPVAAGGGYIANTGPDGAPALDGTAWLYATGVPSVVRSRAPPRSGETC